MVPVDLMGLRHDQLHDPRVLAGVAAVSGAAGWLADAGLVSSVLAAIGMLGGWAWATPGPAVSTWWSELSDDELRARLVQRGVDESAARFLVAHREDTVAAKMIAELLGGN